MELPSLVAVCLVAATQRASFAGKKHVITIECRPRVHFAAEVLRPKFFAIIRGKAIRDAVHVADVQTILFDRRSRAKVAVGEFFRPYFTTVGEPDRVEFPRVVSNVNNTLVDDRGCIETSFFSGLELPDDMQGIGNGS